MTQPQIRLVIEHLEDMRLGGYWVDERQLAWLRSLVTPAC